MYHIDILWQKLGHSVTCLVGKRMVMMSAKFCDSKSKYKDVRILKFNCRLSCVTCGFVKENCKGDRTARNNKLKKDPTKLYTDSLILEEIRRQ